MSIKIHYTPFVSNNIELPESMYLDPIPITRIDLPEESSYSVISPVKINTESKMSDKSASNKSTLNLTWARKTKETSKYNGTTNVPKDLKYKQMMAESAGNAKATSSAGAKGLYQIMDGAHNDYMNATGDIGDLYDPVYNEKVRDWYMNWLSKNPIINTADASDFVKTARQLAAYNWGVGNLKQHLNKMRSQGIDVNNSLDWLQDMPDETINYVKKILLT